VESALTCFIPSVTSLQLLGNLAVIRDALQRLGKVGVVCRLDRYIDQLQAGCADDLKFIDYATAAIHWVYRVLAEEERALVFRGYWGAGGGCAGCAYAPKAEVEFFCAEIEPEILGLAEGAGGSRCGLAPA